MLLKKIKGFTVLTLVMVLTIILFSCDMNDINDTDNDIESTLPEEQLVEMERNPDEGFYWDYLIYIPDTLTENSADYSDHMLVIPNNTGYPTDNYEEHYESAKQKVEDNKLYNYVARELGVPVLIPVFPRPSTIEEAPKHGSHYYTHALDRNTMKLDVEEYKRLDRQLINMIDHGHEFLENQDLKLKEQILMWGFSAQGSFINRFTMLHPEKIQAAAYGGFSAIMLPIEEREDSEGEIRSLIYPVGISDLQEISDKEFNLEAYKNIPQYITRGKKDANDHLPNEDKKIKQLIIEVFETEPAEGDTLDDAKLVFDRYKLAKEVYDGKEIQAQFDFYEDLEHEISEEMMQNMIEFLKKNAGNELNEI